MDDYEYFYAFVILMFVYFFLLKYKNAINLSDKIYTKIEKIGTDV